MEDSYKATEISSFDSLSCQVVETCILEQFIFWVKVKILVLKGARRIETC